MNGGAEALFIAIFGPSRRDRIVHQDRRDAIDDTCQPSHALIHRLTYRLNHRDAVRFILRSVATRKQPPVEIPFLPLYVFLGFSNYF